MSAPRNARPLGLALTSLVAASCAATSSPGTERVDALLLNVTTDAPTRQAIRAFVREHLGPGFRAAPDSLATSPTLRLNPIRLPESVGGTMAAMDLGAPSEFRLMMDGDVCMLVALRDGEEGSEPDAIVLPASAQCRPIR